ncbi:MAG: element excision factor XisH family protein [Pseudanabaena sp.]
MSARDLFHQVVRHALEKENWQITHDPYEYPHPIPSTYPKPPQRTRQPSLGYPYSR